MKIKEKYRFRYNFKNRNKVVRTMIQKIYKQSIDYYLAHSETQDITEKDNEFSVIIEAIHTLEEYLYFYHKEETFDDILTSLASLNVITVLPKEKRGIYGEAKDDKIYINPSFKDSSTLTGKERAKLYVAHELGHIVNSTWMNDIASLLATANLPTRETKQQIYDGFSLLDEAITQERAEEFIYSITKKKRPAKQFYSGRLFDGEPYKSNYDYYGEFQTPAMHFGATIRGIGMSATPEEVMKRLSYKALNKTFGIDIIDEYLQDGQIENLWLMMFDLGTIKNASYAVFGYADKKYIEASKEALANFAQTAVSLRDYREPLKNKLY